VNAGSLCFTEMSSQAGLVRAMPMLDANGRKFFSQVTALANNKP
jgi:hypothetical protein